MTFSPRDIVRFEHLNRQLQVTLGSVFRRAVQLHKPALSCAQEYNQKADALSNQGVYLSGMFVPRKLSFYYRLEALAFGTIVACQKLT